MFDIDCINSSKISDDSSSVLEEQDEGHNHDPVDETDLHSFNPDIVFDVHDFLQLLVSLLNLHPRLLNVEVDPIEDTALLDD